MNPRSHIFISYARRDGEAFAREIHERLEGDEHLTCWRDRLELSGGEQFSTQLEAGIAAARWVLIVLTPAALESEWTAMEWREARKRGVPICPVWPLGARALGEHLERSRLPAGMQRSHIYTPNPEGRGTTTAAAAASEEWRNLVATLRLDKDVTRVPFLAPAPPGHYVDRPAEVASAIARLTARPSQMGSTIAVLRGSGGIGKTTLAKAIAHRDEIVDAFYDGVLWLTLSTRPELVQTIVGLCRALGEVQVQYSGSELHSALGRLRGLLENRRCLLILDDAWKLTDVQPFLELGASVAVLITTRIGDVARVTDPGARVKINAMTDGEASQMLLASIPGEPTPRVVKSCRELARRLGRWPLSLRLASAQLRAQFDFGESPERAIAWVDGNLRAEGVTALDAEGPHDEFHDPRLRDRGVALSIGGSLRLLNDNDRCAFLELGIFPDDTAIPLATAGQQWGVTDVKRTAIALADLSLIDLQLAEPAAITLHDQIRGYAADRLRQENRWTATHRRLVDGWSADHIATDSYAARWICHHLKEADREETLTELLFTYDFLAKRLAAGVSIERLIADFALIGHLDDAAHVGRALSTAARILVRSPLLLSQQIVGRIAFDSPRCQRLVADARDSAIPGVLLPLVRRVWRREVA